MGFLSAAKTVRSPPPCGEGLGVGVAVGGRISCTNNDPSSQNKLRPGQARGAWGRGHSDVGEGEQTEFWEGVDRVRCNADVKLLRMISAT